MRTKILLSGLIIFLFCQQALAQHKKKSSRKNVQTESKLLVLQNATDSLSYALGVNYATWLKQQGVDSINCSAFDSAIVSVLKDQRTLMNNNTAYMSIQEKLKALLQAKSAAALEAGEKFLAANKTKPGVITLPDGLQYEVLTEGKGAKPLRTDKVKVNYEGRLIDGKIFDSSAKSGKPAVFGITQVIAGWTEALQLMPVGSKWRLFIPAALAYGKHGMGSTIPPNAALIFDVELLGIVK